jgi:UDP-N-acetylglucosamine 2-epimerase (non-hydrolysing)/GDP/UDP-N,N'-diacetylbacillosamine 2-epimerase (hydrolysing)
MEAASFALPSVDIGIRQHGRERGRNVIHAEASAESILCAVERALNPAFRPPLEGMENPYGKGAAAEKIVRVLCSVPLGEDLLIKKAIGAACRAGL